MDPAESVARADEKTPEEPPILPAAPAVRFRLPRESSFANAQREGSDGNFSIVDDLRSYLLSSLQIQHLLFLAGSGTSLGSDGPSMWTLWQKCAKLEGFANVLASVNYTPKPGAENIEELLSRCDAYAQIHDDTAVLKFRTEAVDLILRECRLAGPSAKLEAHKSLLLKLARRRARDSRMKLFTTNYDRCFESAAGELGLIPIDGFSFSQPRRFDPRFFEFDIVRRGMGVDAPTFVPGVFQYLKLHGSVDWSASNFTTHIDAEVTAESACIIYPARTKYQRSYEQPHLELMAQYLAALREPNTCLVVAGFGFNDDHLSEPILAALDSNPHFRMLVADPAAEKNLAAGHGMWRRLGEAAQRSDIAFVTARFDAFVTMIPDLQALSPAQELFRAVRNVVGKP